MAADEPWRVNPIGLLDQIAETALDDDYYVVRTGRYSRSRQLNTIVSGFVLTVFALLVTIAAVQTRTDRPATELERQTLIDDIEARQQSLTTREDAARKLRAEVTDLRSSVSSVDPDHDLLRLLTSDVPAAGEGVVIKVDEGDEQVTGGRITDDDLQLLVNGLWYAGAEAIAINGNRLGALSSIRTAGGAITVNFRSIGPPYEVTAIGDTETLRQRFTENAAGRYWESREAQSGVSFSVVGSSDLEVAATPRERLTVKHAKVLEEDE